MRYRGGGVGHNSTREATDFFKMDCHRLDIDRRNNLEDNMDTDEDNVELNEELSADDLGNIDGEMRYHNRDEEQSQCSDSKSEDMDDEDDDDKDSDDKEEEEEEEEEEDEDDGDEPEQDEQDILGYSAL